MQIVIDIPEEIYKARQHWVTNPKRIVDEVDIAIANGIPLDDVLDKIRAEIQTDKDNIENNNIYSRDVIDDGICIGLQMALDTISKHIGGAKK